MSIQKTIEEETNTLTRDLTSVEIKTKSQFRVRIRQSLTRIAEQAETEGREEGLELRKSYTDISEDMLAEAREQARAELLAEIKKRMPERILDQQLGGNSPERKTAQWYWNSYADAMDKVLEEIS